MIINIGQRTDIPAFYSEWFHNRLEEGFVMVRNPYNPDVVTRYELKPSVVDLLVFGTKNPAPMFPYLGDLENFDQYWFVTITPYGRDIEPYVPDKEQVMEDFKYLSRQVGAGAIAWRYDPIFLSERYTVEKHIESFSYMAERLEGSTGTVVTSFIDLFRKVRRNFPEAREVSREDGIVLTKELSAIAKAHGMKLKLCAESPEYAKYGADCSGCATKEVYEEVLGGSLQIPSSVHPARDECSCLLGADIGAYNSCGHFCKYCYANDERSLIEHNMALHDPHSPFLIGNSAPGDLVRDAKQSGWLDLQLHF